MGKKRVARDDSGDIELGQRGATNGAIGSTSPTQSSQSCWSWRGLYNRLPSRDKIAGGIFSSINAALLQIPGWHTASSTLTQVTWGTLGIVNFAMGWNASGAVKLTISDAELKEIIETLSTKELVALRTFANASKDLLPEEKKKYLEYCDLMDYLIAGSKEVHALNWDKLKKDILLLSAYLPILITSIVFSVQDDGHHLSDETTYQQDIPLLCLNIFLIAFTALQLKHADKRAEEMADYLSDANRLSGIAEGILKGHVKPFLADKAHLRMVAAAASVNNIEPTNPEDSSPTDIIGTMDEALKQQGISVVERQRAMTLSRNTNDTKASSLDPKVAHQRYPGKRAEVLGPRKK